MSQTVNVAGQPKRRNRNNSGQTAKQRKKGPSMGENAPPAAAVGPSQGPSSTPIPPAPQVRFESHLLSHDKVDREASDVWWFMAGVEVKDKPLVMPDLGHRSKSKPATDFIACRECVAYVILLHN